MRIGILSFNQRPEDKIYRYTSGTLASAYCKAGTHVRISKKIIRELVPDTSVSSSPEKYFLPKIQVVLVPPAELNPPTTPSSLDLFYPSGDQRSGHENHKSFGHHQDWSRFPTDAPEIQFEKVVYSPVNRRKIDKPCVISNG